MHSVVVTIEHLLLIILPTS